ncbi:MAG TPA: endolytic transglycosylase MltG, partial [Candidimonas sp.]|nr:endolytic transglycosylase MltG [Candidimonas sp.]
AGRAALLAALHPEAHKFLYFVSRGDGTSEFSANLLDHNRAVSKFILGRRN